MTDKQVIKIIETLAESQGFYGRLLRMIDDMDDDSYNEFFDQFKDCKTNLDVILKIEQ